jgi:hypothetical protein
MPTRRKTGGRSRQGIPNKIPLAVKEMVIQALHDVGGVSYLQEQAKANPAAFMSLLGRILPMKVSGDGGNPIMIITGVPRPGDAVTR